MKCPHCDEDITRCQVSGCENLAQYEGWYDQKDGFGVPTGMSRQLKVCSEHKQLLRGS